MNRPWMPLYVADYRRDTAHLSAAEHGAYLLLIMHYWANGSIPDDDRQIARIVSMTPAEWKRARPVVQAFFQDGWKHKRIEFEMTEAARISNAGRAGGLASAAARRQRSGNDPPTTVERPLNDRTNDQGNDPSTNSQALHSQSQRKKDAPDGAPTRYAFESGVIRLNERDLDRWKAAYSQLDVPAELMGLTKWASEQKDWFFAVQGALAKRNREIKAKPAEGEFKWNGIEGVT